MNIHEKLLKVQVRLNAPKKQFNEFGGYLYRSLEDINEAIKPLLFDNELSLTLTDQPVLIGDRTYIQATATLTDIADPEQKISVSGYAREAEARKKMDTSQITGATSSYARKYCLNGLFAIDDTKDADATQGNNKTHEKPTEQKAPKPANDNSSKNLITQEQISKVTALAGEVEPFDCTDAEKKETVKKVAALLGVSTKSTTAEQFDILWEQAQDNNFNSIYAAFEAAETNGGE